MMEITGSYALGGATPRIIPIRYTLIQTTDTPIDSFKAICLMQPALQRELSEIWVWRDQTCIFHGLVDEQIQSITPQGSMVSLTARSKSALLCDNEALPAQYHAVGFMDIFARHIAPYGFQIGASVPSKKAATFFVAKGESELDVINRFCTMIGIRNFFFTPRDELIVGHPAKSKTWTVSNLGKGIPYLSLEKTFSRHRCISEVWIKSKQGSYKTVIQNPQAKQYGIRRRRYLNPANEWSLVPQADAMQKIERSMRNREQMELVLAGNHTISLYDTVIVSLHAKEPSEAWQVAGVRTDRTYQGDRITLRLIKSERIL